jgi:hypothetical protein
VPARVCLAGARWRGAVARGSPPRWARGVLALRSMSTRRIARPAVRVRVLMLRVLRKPSYCRGDEHVTRHATSRRSFRPVVLVCLIASFAVDAAQHETLPGQLPLPATAEWPGFRGAGMRATAATANIPLHWSRATNVAWSVDVPGYGWSSPVVWNGVVFFKKAASTATTTSLSFALKVCRRMRSTAVFVPATSSPAKRPMK